MTIPASVGQYMGIIERAIKATANGHGIRPIVMAAILDHESQAGRALKPPGPEGTGDFKMRLHTKYSNSPLFRMLTRDDGGYGFMPYDLKGWGRGLFQIDFGAWTAWCLETNDHGIPLWAIPEANALKACQIFGEALAALSGDEDGAIAAYNCGWPRVKEELENLTPVDEPHDKRQSKIIALDSLTTHSYLSTILNKIERWQATDVKPPPKPEGIT